jgi:hypothetical protein
MAKRARAPRNARRDVRDARPRGRRLGHTRSRDPPPNVSALSSSLRKSKYSSVYLPGCRHSGSLHVCRRHFGNDDSRKNATSRVARDEKTLLTRKST